MLKPWICIVAAVMIIMAKGLFKWGRYLTEINDVGSCCWLLSTFIHTLSGMSKEDAMSAYIALAKELIQKHGMWD